MATNFKLKRSAVASKRPGTTDLELGELALNTYDGFLYSETTGAGSTVSLLTPWQEKYGQDAIYYTGGNVGIGSTIPTAKLNVSGNVNIVGDLDVNGHTELDHTNIVGINTITGVNNFSLDLVGNANNNSIVFRRPSGGTNNTHGFRISHHTGGGNQIGGETYLAIDKVDKSAGAFVAPIVAFSDDGLHFLDSRKIHIGGPNAGQAEGDLQIYNIADVSYLRIDDGNPLLISKGQGTENIAKFIPDGAVELYHNDGLRFETTGVGVSVTGLTTTTSLAVSGIATFLGGASFLNNDVLYFGGSSSTGISTDYRLRIYSDGTDSYISEATGAGDLRLSSDSRVEIRNAALSHTVASFNTGVGVTVFDRFKVSGISSFTGDVEFHGASGITSAFFDKSDNSFKFIDNVKAKFGTNNNLEIYHNPVNSYIANNSNNLYITNTDGEIFIQAKAGEDSIICHDDGAVQLYHDGALKCQTRDFGFSIFQDLTISNNLDVTGITTLADDKLTIQNNGGQVQFSANIYTFNGESSGTAFRASSGNNIGFEAYYNSLKRFTTDSKGISVHDNLSGIGVTIEHNGQANFAGIVTAKSIDVTNDLTVGSIGISTGRITGPAVTYIDPATVGDNTGLVVIKGNLQVDGTTTTVNSETLTVTDKNIEIAKGQGNDAAVDGAGITVDSTQGDKTWNWVDATDSWTSSEHIRIPDDKVIGFTTDTNTHISRPTANTLLLTGNGAGMARFIKGSSGSSSGQTKIGPDADSVTASTNYEFQISGYSTDNCFALSLKHGTSGVGKTLRQAFFFKNAAGNNIDLARFQAECTANTAGSESGDLSFYTTNSGTSGEKLRILSNGNIGIGTDDPSSKLQVDGGNITIKGTSPSLIFNDTNNASDFRIRINDGSFKIQDTSNANAVRFIIKSSGRVGINTTVPSRQLEVLGDSNLKGNLNVTGVSTFTGAIDANGDLDVDGHTELDNLKVVGVATFTGGGAKFENGIETFNVKYITNTNTKITFGTGIISLHGNVGINSTAPTSKLDVVGGVKVSGVSTFTGAIDANGDLDVDGHTELDNVNIAGVSTFVSFLDVNDTTQSSDKDTGSIITEGGVGIEKNLNVGGIINSSTDVQINGTSVVDTALNDAVAMAIALG